VTRRTLGSLWSRYLEAFLKDNLTSERKWPSLPVPEPISTGSGLTVYHPLWAALARFIAVH
jgi:hypothetical protein